MKRNSYLIDLRKKVEEEPYLYIEKTGDIPSQKKEEIRKQQKVIKREKKNEDDDLKLRFEEELIKKLKMKYPSTKEEKEKLKKSEFLKKYIKYQVSYADLPYEGTIENKIEEILKEKIDENRLELLLSMIKSCEHRDFFLNELEKNIQNKLVFDLFKEKLSHLDICERIKYANKSLKEEKFILSELRKSSKEERKISKERCRKINSINDVRFKQKIKEYRFIVCEYLLDDSKTAISEKRMEELGKEIDEFIEKHYSKDKNKTDESNTKDIVKNTSALIKNLKKLKKGEISLTNDPEKIKKMEEELKQNIGVDLDLSPSEIFNKLKGRKDKNAELMKEIMNKNKDLKLGKMGFSKIGNFILNFSTGIMDISRESLSFIAFAVPHEYLKILIMVYFLIEFTSLNLFRGFYLYLNIFKIAFMDIKELKYDNFKSYIEQYILLLNKDGKELDKNIVTDFEQQMIDSLAGVFDLFGYVFASFGMGDSLVKVFSFLSNIFKKSAFLGLDALHLISYYVLEIVFKILDKFGIPEKIFDTNKLKILIQKGINYVKNLIYKEDGTTLKDERFKFLDKMMKQFEKLNIEQLANLAKAIFDKLVIIIIGPILIRNKPFIKKHFKDNDQIQQLYKNLKPEDEVMGNLFSRTGSILKIFEKFTN